MKFLLHTILIFTVLFNAPLTIAQDTGPETGTVAETMSVANYTYLRLEEPDIWIATPALTVSEGDRVAYSGGMEMREFHSKALDRTFDSISFIQNVRVLSKDVESIHREARGGNEAHSDLTMISKPVSVEAPAPGEIARLDDGKTIAEILAGSTELNGQSVQLRAKVIKISKNVMAKNWITLQDGTGMEPDNKLLATSEELVSPGDRVIASGNLRYDADIGSGYKYKVLLEKATFTKSAE